jgi:hypothetical protein
MRRGGRRKRRDFLGSKFIAKNFLNLMLPPRPVNSIGFDLHRLAIHNPFLPCAGKNWAIASRGDACFDVAEVALKAYRREESNGRNAAKVNRGGQWHWNQLIENGPTPH